MNAPHACPEVRRIPFDYPSDMSADWNPRDPELSALLNGLSLTMPYLEPYLIRTMREAAARITDPALRAEAEAFMGQEGQHFRAHRRFNDIIKAKGCPRLAEVEDEMERSYARLQHRSLPVRMAYSAGFEAMTIGLSRWLIEDRVRLSAGADSRVVSMVLWHMVEETEHKLVAFDVYQALHGRYWRRMIGVFHGSLHVLYYGMRGCMMQMRESGRTGWRPRWRLLVRFAWMARSVLPALLHAALPGHDPRKAPDPAWVTAWLAAYRAEGGSGVPLVDTADPDMPIPFRSTVQRAAS